MEGLFWLQKEHERGGLHICFGKEIPGQIWQER